VRVARRQVNVDSSVERLERQLDAQRLVAAITERWHPRQKYVALEILRGARHKELAQECGVCLQTISSDAKIIKRQHGISGRYDFVWHLAAMHHLGFDVEWYRYPFGSPRKCPPAPPVTARTLAAPSAQLASTAPNTSAHTADSGMSTAEAVPPAAMT
jgi:hypothetical protein